MFGKNVQYVMDKDYLTNHRGLQVIRPNGWIMLQGLMNVVFATVEVWLRFHLDHHRCRDAPTD